MILEQELLQKLIELRHNNNKLIADMKKLDLETIETEKQLTILNKDLKDLQECFSIISKPLSEISSQIAYLKEQSKGKKKSTSKKSNTKKKNQKLKIHQMENLTEKYLGFDEFIEDDEEAK